MFYFAINYWIPGLVCDGRLTTEGYAISVLLDQGHISLRSATVFSNYNGGLQEEELRTDMRVEERRG